MEGINLNLCTIDTSLKLNIKDFEIRETIGTGSFAKVKLAKNIKDKNYYAVKSMKKAHLIRFKQVDHIKNEILILKAIDNDFIVKLFGYMQDETSLYIVMQLVNGGELFTYLRAMSRLDAEAAMFYSAQVICIFEYLHKLDIIYRDLKPENIILDRSGYIKLIDFGFAKYCNGLRTYTLCGTPEYLAPEVIKNKGHGKAADWWTFGVFLYELIAGIDPFTDEDPMKIYENILNSKLKFPSFFNKVAKSLVKKLLEQDLSKRYGNLSGGINDIKSHKFYKDISFSAIQNMELKPPYVPRVSSPSDISNFPSYPNSDKEILATFDKSEDPFSTW